jgi:protein phosphatase
MQKLHTDHTPYCTGYAESMIGGRAENQDSYGFSETPRGLLVTVCDGMGGGPGGKTASTIAAEEILAEIYDADKDVPSTDVITKAVQRANQAIIAEADRVPELKGMGSTTTILLISEESAFVAHVGDSRVYQIRGKKKIFRTFDHSMVFELVKRKTITEEQARLSEQSNVITRALGIAPDVEVDIAELPYKKGDRFVLCSDGIHGMLPEKDLLKLFSNKKSDLDNLVEDIASQIDQLGQENGGGHDNLTIAIIETNIDSILKPRKCKLYESIFNWKRTWLRHRD